MSSKALLQELRRVLISGVATVGKGGTAKLVLYLHYLCLD